MAANLIEQVAPFLAPRALLLIAAVALDLAIGDPVYPAHPVRLIGRTLSLFEKGLRKAGADGYGGGNALFAMLGIFWLGVLMALMAACSAASSWLAWGLHLFLLYSFIALGDLVWHVWRVERALLREDLAGARVAIARLVGRDTVAMDAGACRRAAIESLSENLTDGVISPVVWYAVLGLPGLLLFKVVSTMDSMVGNKTPRYLRFGWCGARLDDALNYIPARLSLPLIACVAAFVPQCSAAKAWRMGLSQHALLPSPNSGWSEAAMAGAIQRRLVGPIWMNGALVTDIWIGDMSDSPASSHEDTVRALMVAIVAGLLSALVAGAALMLAY